MTILLPSRCRVAAPPQRVPARVVPIRAPRALKPVSSPQRPRLEMRWHLNANGRLTCSWHLVFDTVRACADQADAKPPSWPTQLTRALPLPTGERAAA
jgi:hypothetical protein